LTNLDNFFRPMAAFKGPYKKINIEQTWNTLQSKSSKNLLRNLMQNYHKNHIF
jgi:hypothetical protein